MQGVGIGLRQPVLIGLFPPGICGAGAYNDENDNRHLNTNFFGYPVEGYGLSNGIRAILSRPRFIDAAFWVGDGQEQVVLHVRYRAQI